MPPLPPRPVPTKAPRFDLSRWFAIVAGVSIGMLSVVVGWLLHAFIVDRMVRQEATLTHEFVRSVVMTERPLQAFFADPHRGVSALVDASFLHIGSMPDVLRANVYDRERRVIWSSDRTLIGGQFGVNDELEQAFAGDVVAHRDAHDEDSPAAKDERNTLPQRSDMFIEIYVPVSGPDGGEVLGVVEFYKQPRALNQALRELTLYIAVGAAAVGALLYLALFGMVRRADLTIRAQQQRLVETERLAAIGEMSSAVAHGIRNPLASIRSSAELIPDSDPARAAEAAQDIVDASDRLEAWVRELLSYSRPLDKPADAVDLAELVQTCVEDFAREMQTHRIDAQVIVPADLPAVHADGLLLRQVLRSLIANAIEALDRGGRIVVRGDVADARRRVLLSVADNGPGIAPDNLARVGKPFFTTKTRGLGVGLALARRVVERFGGRLEITSETGRGTTVTLHMTAA